jgi:hypothetical protein
LIPSVRVLTDTVDRRVSRASPLGRPVLSSLPASVSGNIKRAITSINCRFWGGLSWGNAFALEVLASNRESAMVRHVDHRDWFDAIVRANRVMVLSRL